MQTIAIVGASLAGLRAAETLRSEGFAGRLVWIGAEPHLPYDRPPLSKEVLRGEWEPERVTLRKDGVADLEADLRLGARATGLDLAARSVALDDGSAVDFDGLLIATGAAPRALPGAPALEGIHLLRTLDDALALREAFRRGPRVCVAGAGFIGCEVAASARALGLETTLVEPLEAPCVRGLGVRLGGVLAEVHRDHGVDLRLGTIVERIEGEGRVERVRLSDGTAVDADLVVVGIGVAPVTDWLAGSGLALDDGVVCDATCLAAPGVVAAGDVARWPNPLFGRAMRVEHWSNAVEQGVHAAKRLLAGDGPGEPFAPVPSFWSDQYELRIQSAGAADVDDELVVVAGSLEERRFVAIQGAGGRLTGAVAWNRARDLIRYRKLLARGASWEEALAF